MRLNNGEPDIKTTLLRKFFMRSCVLLLFLCFISLFSSAQSNFTPQHKQVYTTVVAIGKAWANNDLKVLDKLIAADYVHTDVWGNIQTRKEWISYVQTKKKEGIINPEMEFEDVQIQISGNNAFVTGANIITGQLTTADQKDQQQKIRFTQVLSKENGKWKRKLFQGTFLKLQPASDAESTRNHLERAILIAENPIVAQQPKVKTAQEEIIELEKSFAAAIKTQDTTQTKLFQADTYFLAYTVQGMPIEIMPKQSWLNLLKDYVTESFTIDDIKVNVYGNIAIAMLMFTQKATVRGQDRSGQFVLTDIWYKGHKGWRIAERHSTRPGSPVNMQTK